MRDVKAKEKKKELETLDMKFTNSEFLNFGSEFCFSISATCPAVL